MKELLKAGPFGLKARTFNSKHNITS